LTASPARILIIAGSDSSGGAGIQADIKTATALGAYAMTAITAVTVQDTQRVHSIHPIPPQVVRDQILACLNDIGADAIKTGMLNSAELVTMVADTLSEHARGIPLVVDPVMISTSGTALLDDDAVELLKTRLLPLATLVTPNLPEFLRLTGSQPGRLVAPHAGAGAMLLTGGHALEDRVVDTLFDPARDGPVEFGSQRIDTKHTHGTGCTLATAIAVGLGQGLPLIEAIERARVFVHEAIRTAPGFGRGQGPINHFAKS
jgi:hydroxymethylpyrimidine/phosphomethylpyrimidine kinase